MGIYIPGMDMPNCCINCPFMVSRESDDCILQSEEANASFDSWEDMRNGCPLVFVSDHGALGDLDGLSAKISDACEAARQQWRDSFSRIPLTGDAYEEGRMDGLAEAIDLLGTADTIIPADPKEGGADV